MTDKKADLAGPGIGDYAELDKILPEDYTSLLSPKETQNAIYAAKDYIEENLCKELNLIRVTVPLIVDVDSGVNDLLALQSSDAPACCLHEMRLVQRPAGDQGAHRRGAQAQA